jgi:glutamine synthetase
MIKKENATIFDTIKARDVELVRFLYCGGTDNKIRGKSVHAAKLDSYLNTGVAHPWALLCFNMFDLPIPSRTFTSVGEVRIVPDPGTFALIPYLPRTAYMFSDLTKLDGTPWELCPRWFLKRMIDKAAAKGLLVRAAFENEFYLTRKSANGYEPLDDSHCYTSIGMDNAHETVIDIIDALHEQRIQVEQYYPEYGGGQQELTVEHDEALRAADKQLAFRETVRGVALRHGLHATFAPVPFQGRAGNGAHIHLSVWDRRARNNVFADPNRQYWLSQEGRLFIGGVLKHIRGLLALTASSVNSYRRLQPERLSSGYACYGPDNREASVRIASPFRGRESESINLEFRPSDPSANPYIALGGLIAAGLDGMEHEIDPGEPLLQDPSWLSEEERGDKGIRRYPTSLDEALNELEKDSCLVEALGPVFAREYLLLKRADCELFKDNDAAYEIDVHFYRY